MVLVRIGLLSPVVTQIPGVHNAWETDAGMEELAAVAVAADRLGFDHLTCSEHVAVPASQSARGTTYWDPLPTFGYLAAVTDHIRLTTQVLVLGYHHPLAIAKQYGTLDRISGGRLVLGLGVGSLREEFDLLGADFAHRGKRADDALRALRACLGRPEPTYHGEFFDIDGLVVEPYATQARVPFWIGGRSARSLRRALELGDGWVPFGLGLDDLRQMLAHATGETETPPGFEVVLPAGRALDPLDDPTGALRRIERLGEAGATIASVALSSDSLAHHLEQLAALADLVPQPPQPPTPDEGDAR